MMGDLVPDSLWERVEPLLPPRPPQRHHHSGRRPADDRAALAGIVFVLEIGNGCYQLPRSLLGVSGVTCHRRIGSGPVLGGRLHVRALKGGPHRTQPKSIAAGPAPSTT